MGAPIDKNLDKTQLSVISKPAAHDLGVVFAYEDLKAAKEEGFGCDIIELEFSKAVKARHKQEASLGAPQSLLILNTDITAFKKIGRGDNVGSPFLGQLQIRKFFGCSNNIRLWVCGKLASSFP